jgi:hypothetical protein
MLDKRLQDSALDTQLLRAECDVFKDSCRDKLIVRVLKQQTNTLANEFEVSRFKRLAGNPYGRLVAKALWQQTIKVQHERGFARAIGTKHGNALFLADGE